MVIVKTFIHCVDVVRGMGNVVGWRTRRINQLTAGGLSGVDVIPSARLDLKELQQPWQMNVLGAMFYVKKGQMMQLGCIL